jgi:hypothetical protein
MINIKRLKDFPEGSGSLTADDVFIFMDNPSGVGVTKKISLSQLSSAIGGGGGGAVGISNIVEDISPELGGSLDARNFSISGISTLTSTSGNFTQRLLVNGTGVSVSGHTHTSSNIIDFNSSVSGLLPSGLVRSNTSGITGASGVNNIVYMSQASYDAIGSGNYNPSTIYFIV